MEKVVVLFYKLEECYDRGEGYCARVEKIHELLKSLEKIKERYDSDKIILSAYSDYSWDEKATLLTEVSMNIHENYNFIEFGKKFYDGKMTPALVNEYINELSETRDLKKVIFINNEQIFCTPASGSTNIIIDGGLENIVNALDIYSREDKSYSYKYINQ